MKRLILSLFALCIAATATLQADDIASGEYYHICTLDGLLALSNGGSADNNVILSMKAYDETDQGQLWQLTESDGYWQIKSACGNVCADNPSESHSKWNNQLLQWQTSGGNNQKWTFEAADNGTFYIIPYESSDKTKGYGYDDNGKLTFQAKGGDNTRFLLKQQKSNALPTVSAEGYYALQSISTYPDYIYKSEGHFLTFSDAGKPTLADDYTYNGSRLYLSKDEEGHLRITLPHRGKYVYATTSSLLLSDESDESHAEAATFALYSSTDELTLSSRVCLLAGTDTPSNAQSSVRVLYPGTNGTSVSVKKNELGSSYVFRLVSLPAGEQTDRLAALVSEATEALTLGLDDEAKATLQAAIDAANDELNYPYLTTSDVNTAVSTLQAAIDAAKSTASAAPFRTADRVTGINHTGASNAPTVTAQRGHISVSGANNVQLFNTAGQRVATTAQALPHGTYIVVADGHRFKVML